MRRALEVADVFRRHGAAYRETHAGHLSRGERRVMGAIETCRSAALDRRHDLQLAEAHMAGMGRTPSRPAVAEDVRHLDRWP